MSETKQFISWLLQAAIIAVGFLLINTISGLSVAVESLKDQVAILRAERAADRVQIEQNSRQIEKHDGWIRELQRGR
jgi:hypothetical protein